VLQNARSLLYLWHFQLQDYFCAYGDRQQPIQLLVQYAIMFQTPSH